MSYLFVCMIYDPNPNQWIKPMNMLFLLLFYITYMILFVLHTLIMQSVIITDIICYNLNCVSKYTT